MKTTIFPFFIKENSNGSFAVIFNPDSKHHGRAVWRGEQMVMSPFPTIEEAIEKAMAYSENYEFETFRTHFKNVEDTMKL